VAKVLPAVVASLSLLAPMVVSAAETKNLAVCKRIESGSGPGTICRGRVHPKLPVFVFEFHKEKLTVRHAGRKPVLQTLASPDWGAPGPPIILHDVNFDGYADVHVVVQSNYSCEFHYFWLFDSSKGRFGKIMDEHNLVIGGLSCGWIQFHAARKEITNAYSPRGSSSKIRYIYKWRGRELETRRAVVRVYSKSGKCRERHYRAAPGKRKSKLTGKRKSKLIGIGFKTCPRDPDAGGAYPETPSDRDLRKRETFDKLIR